MDVSLFIYGNTLEQVILFHLPINRLVERSENPGDFLLHAINVFELLEVLIGKVVFLHEFLDFLSDFPFCLRVLGEQIEGHSEIV